MTKVQAVVYLEDRFLTSPAEARVSLFDRGYLLGDSIFETLRAYDGKVFALSAHLERLTRAAEVTGIRPPLECASLGERIVEAVGRSAVASAYVRVTVSRGEGGGGGLGTAGCDHPILSIVVREHPGYPPEAYAHGIDTRFLLVRKVPAACLDPAIKTGSYLPNVMAMRELERHAMLEGIMLSTTDDVVSGAISNLFIVKGEQLQTPDEASGCRPGVTRAAVLDLAGQLGLAVRRGPVTALDVAAADEAFFTNTLMECLPIRRIEGRDLASPTAGSVTRRVHEAYRALTR